MNSIIATLGTEDFPRLRIGVATEEMEKYNTADFVLARFTTEEEKLLPEIIEQAVQEITKYTASKK
jgi:PTH1 family peptidyl-tRNA hydrolase